MTYIEKNCYCMNELTIIITQTTSLYWWQKHN